MKDQILKIAKVKSEKEFYKKYPTEEAFMKAHGKAFKKAAMGSKMVNDQLHQLTDFGNPPIAQKGTAVNPNTGMFQMPMSGKSVSQFDTMAAGYGATPPPEGFGNVKSAGGFDAAGAGMAALGALPGIIAGAEAIGAQKKGIKKANQASQLSGLAAQAAGMRERVERKYVRPEDALVQPGQLGNPYGTGTNYLAAENGTMIGGNPTEIQNTYAPTNTMYTDLGFEPLGETLKQYRHGGEMPKAELGEYFQDSGQAQIGSAAGSAIGNMILPGVGGAIGGLIGKVGGNLLGGAKDARELKKYQDQTEANTQQAAWQNTLQGQFSGFMEDGGKVGDEYKWVSHTWQPQTIAKFGDYDVKDLLKPPHDADMLRSGGHLAQVGYTAPSEEAMFTGRPELQPLTMNTGGRLPSTNMMFDTDRYPRAQSGVVLDSNIRSKTDLQTTSAGNNFNENLRNAISSVDTYADGRPVEKTDLYSITKGRNDNQRVKEFLRSQTGDAAPQYSMQKTYKPLFSDQYKTVSREIGAGRGERRMADMEQFLGEGNMEHGGQLAMGGDLEVGDGGYLETMSYNPNLPGGEIGMFRGASHDNGGIKTKYGENEVEVEGNEPVVKLKDGGSSENLVVFGNIKINKNIADLMGDRKAKGKKFKTYIADVAKNDAKQLKKMNKALDLIENADENSAFDHLTLNTGNAMLQGTKAWQKINAEKIKQAGIVQDAIHQTANELGVKSDRLAEGKLEKETDPSMMGKNGKKMKKAQTGDKMNLKDLLMTPDRASSPFLSAISDDEFLSLDPITQEQIRRGIPVTAGLPGSNSANQLEDVVVTGNRRISAKGLPMDIIPYERKSISSSVPDYIDPNTLPNIQMAAAASQGEGKGKRFNWDKLGDIGKAALSYAEPWLRPSNANEPLPPDQLYPEYFALANNQLEPVQAQTFQPMLDNPYDISLNDQLNAVDSQSRAAIRASGNNPAAQAQIMAQSLEAKNRVLGEQNRINQANKMQVYDKNRALLNDAQLKNLAILDQQYVRQSQAKSNTKQQAMAALSSIAAKTAQQRATNRKLGIMENMYNFRFSPSGRAYNLNAPAQFNLSGNPSQGSGQLAEGYEDIYNSAQQRIGSRRIPKSSSTNTPSLSEIDSFIDKNGGKTSKTKARNSSIVKALKNL